MAAAGIIYNADGKVLLMKRHAKAVHGGTWGLPAGSVEDGETTEGAALREFSEECGSPCEAPLEFISNTAGFALYKATGIPFTPTLNDEHTEYGWFDSATLPTPLHPGLESQLDACAMDYFESKRQADENGYITVFRNPISRAGVFQYSGRVLPSGDPSRMYSVYRPASELSRPETLNSFKLLPIIDEHVMLGDGHPTAAEDKGVHGSTGEDVTFEGIDVLASLRIFSRSMARLLNFKKGLSLGYRCRYEKTSGAFEGQAYDYIQRDIRGNHLALVREGRVGTEVLDHHSAFDHVDLALDTGEEVMADENTAAENDATAKDADGEKEMTLTEITAAISAFMPVMTKMQEFMAASTAASKPADVLDNDDGTAEDADGDDDKPKDDKKDAMDAAEISTLKNRLAKLEGVTTKSFLGSIAERDRLANSIAGVVGTFDYSAMDESEVAEYGVKKFGLTADKGTEKVAIAAFLAGRKQAAPVAATYALDSVKSEGLLAKRMAKK